MVLRLDGFLVDEHKRAHFRTLLYLGVVLFPFFSVLDIFYDNFISAAIEGGVTLCFMVALLLVKLNYLVKQTIYAILFVMLLGGLGIMWQDTLMLPWIPVLTVIGFGFVGTKQGRYWAIFTITCVTVLFVVDLLSASPAYSVLIAINIVVSCMTLAFIVDYAYSQLAKKQAVLMQETARKERLEVSKRFAENMAHLINNEMQAVVGIAEVAQFNTQDSKLKQYLEDIMNNADKASQHANQLAIFAEKNVGIKQPFDLQTLVKSLFETWCKATPEYISTTFNCLTKGRQCVGDVRQLEALILGMLNNAHEAIDRNRHAKTLGNNYINVTLSDYMLDEDCRTRKLKAGCYFLICIEDNGGGVLESIKDKVFEPFVSTGFIGRGMGLAAAFGTIKDHHGHIEVASDETGSVFKVWLPVMTELVAT